jgi:hypothetical protein
MLNRELQVRRTAMAVTLAVILSVRSGFWTHTTSAVSGVVSVSGGKAAGA